LRCQVLLQRAQVLFKLARRDQQVIDAGRIADAVAMLEEALKLVELPRASTTGADAERAEFYAHFAPIFDMLVDAYLAAGQRSKALQATEWRRNRTLRDQVLVARDQAPARPPSTQETELLQDLREEFAKARALLMASEMLSESNQAQIDAANREVDRIRGELVNLRADLHRQDPFIRSILEQEAVEDYHHAAASALRDLFSPADASSRRQAVLVYHIGARWSHLFLLTPTDVEPDCFPLLLDSSARALGAGQGPLNARTARMLVRQLVAAATRSPQDSATDELPRGPGAQGTVSSPKGTYGAEQRLAASRVLLPRDALDKLRRLQASRILVIPDGPLHELPLEMLETAAGEYVLDVLPPMCYAPSALILQTIQHRDVKPADGLLLTVAPPYPQSAGAPTQADRDSRSRLPRYDALPELKHARAESEGIFALFASLSGSRKLLPRGGHSVSESAVRRDAEGMRFLHFAAHGHVEETFDNLFGGLILSKSAPDDDGVLSLYDIEQLKLSACELAILSACRTNRGADRPLEAGSTLARAFLSSGVQRVVCSHWDVDDESTRELMLEFMKLVTRDLRAGHAIDYALALHTARRHVRQQPQWQSPDHWAPFVLIGPARGPSSIASPTSTAAHTARP
jgi:CHAT domain-containing protein